LKEVALDRTLWRTCFGRGYRPVVRQTTEWLSAINDLQLPASVVEGRAEGICSDLQRHLSRT
jgi:hypothetical protein